MPTLFDPNAGSTPSSGVSDVPQFSTAEYTSAAGTRSCKVCGNQISGDYFRVNGKEVCATCAPTVKAKLPIDSHAAFTAALIYGIGGAVIGLAVYSGFIIATGISIGYLALAVGWIVAKAILMGSKGVGGPRYQAIAVILTYFAISLSYVVIPYGYALMHPENGVPDIPLSELLMLGLASPILRVINSPTHILGLVILFVGLSIAFRMTKARAVAQFEGPFKA
jgi:hypothetical protein